ncbi:MAG: hypothetical protein CO186_03310 [Zetaproteobacteria bacterium CG_4_9_14_3_um_filter_49_83]|nr:MAG: hypothetical protein AUJ56_00245 [Zetaproteobacteria bacterium CG1_02_49_23]PIQ32468.1 MAG: hypothetical protein COW62_07525 [Zetaproteobacteria bacterium CG17_big_fil_post_rev_8_21_14_2_50_50_13]PIV31316.1 MAG: hypothetical protein COS35_02050 [Zetaproteobacteria bacterium CG02_land_8_20_14_3_00_50_9]PIY55072.1 MAG: hypothetical protein COZ00_11460 [Zetaproteobacteria bacterium CG_4_10_14_0_8_um_filter_49_80]PJA35947.1 MAG: hypothetical protein CO186_03310 [Zetaproteobacteria bacterium
MLRINKEIVLPDAEIEIQAIRAQGAGGQNVNKVSSSAHLRFDIAASSLPESWKHNLLHFADQRISAEGVVIIKAQRFRSLERNRQDALTRLRDLILAANKTHKKRKPTRRSLASKERRLEGKVRRGMVKSMRKKVADL